MNRWHHVSLFLPFTLDHICSYSCVTKKDYLSVGGKERVQRQQRVPEAMAPIPEQLWKTKLEEKPASCPATVAQLGTRGLSGTNVPDVVSVVISRCKASAQGTGAANAPGSTAKGVGRGKPRGRPKRGEKKSDLHWINPCI